MYQYQVVAALLATNSAVTFACPSRGPVAGVRRVDANSTMIFYQSFRANEVATVSIARDGDTDLDIYVFDANGNLITRAVGLSDRETVSFIPTEKSEISTKIAYFLGFS